MLSLTMLSVQDDLRATISPASTQRYSTSTLDNDVYLDVTPEVTQYFNDHCYVCLVDV